MARRQPVDNLVINGDFNRVPTFVAATSGNNRVVDGTAVGFTPGSETVSPSTLKQFYQWKVNMYNTTNPSAQYDTNSAPNGGASMKVTGTAVKERVNLTLGIRTFSDLNQPADIRNNLIRVQPNTDYVLTFKMKTEISNGVGTPGVYGATMQVAVHSGTSNTANSFLNGALNSKIGTTTDWTDYTMTFTTGATSQYVNLAFGIYGDTNNYADMTAWFADIRLNTATGLSRTTATSRTTASNRVAVRDMGTALRFDGVDDNVEIPDADIPASTFQNGFTLAGWVKVDTLTTNRIFDKSTNTTAGDGFSFQLTSLGFQTRVNGGGMVNSNRLSSYNTYVFVCTTVNASALVTQYINGVVSGTPATTGALSGITTTNALRIGNRATATDRPFDGSIDEPRIWNRALTADEVKNLYLYNIVPQDGLVVEYLFDEASGATALDTSGNGNHGTITGATYTTDVPLVPRTAV